MATKSKKPTEKVIELKDMNESELIAQSKELLGQIQKRKLEMAVGRVKNLREVFGLRKQLARVKTMLNIKKMR